MSRNEWRTMRATLIKIHNVQVKRSAAKISAEARATNNNVAAAKRINILKSCLIDGDDSISIAIEKQMFYWFTLGYASDRASAIASVPDRWNIKKLKGTPQLVIIYRKVKKSRSGNYELVIPHYDGTRNPQAINYKKGNRMGILTLKDNSTFVVNAASDAEAEKVYKHYKRYINTKYLTNDFKITQRRGKAIDRDEYKPIRADYYPTGDEEDYPKWQHFY